MLNPLNKPGLIYSDTSHTGRPFGPVWETSPNLQTGQNAQNSRYESVVCTVFNPITLILAVFAVCEYTVRYLCTRQKHKLSYCHLLESILLECYGILEFTLIECYELSNLLWSTGPKSPIYFDEKFQNLQNRFLATPKNPKRGCRGVAAPWLPNQQGPGAAASCSEDLI